jgi:hypothetical protein
MNECVAADVFQAVSFGVRLDRSLEELLMLAMDVSARRHNVLESARLLCSMDQYADAMDRFDRARVKNVLELAARLTCARPAA